jgi:phosphoglycolate phosphatase
MAEKVLSLLGLAGLFAHLQGTDGFPYKPDPEIIRRVRAAVRPEWPDHRVWMVGDTPRDVETGRRAGVRTAAVFYGYGAPASLRPANPDLLADNFDTLVNNLLGTDSRHPA